MELRGERITVRDFELGDADAVHAYVSDPLVTRHITFDPNDLESSRAFVKGAIAMATETPRSAFQMGIVRCDTKELIGHCGLRVSSPYHRRGEIDYVLRRDQWGNGFATEAARLLLRFGFTELHLHRIEATCSPDNPASTRVLAKVGMKVEGRLRDHIWNRGAWRDSLLFAVLEPDWRTAPGV